MQVSDMAVADVDLPAVKNVVVAVAFRGGFHAEDEAPRVRLGDRDCRQAVTFRDSGKPIILLGFAAEMEDFSDAQLRGLHHGTHSTADPRKFLDYNRFGEMTKSHPAAFPSDGDADPPAPRGHPRWRVMDGLGVLHFRDEWPDGSLREFANLLP